jgi:hypothetical protein
MTAELITMNNWAFFAAVMTGSALGLAGGIFIASERPAYTWLFTGAVTGILPVVWRYAFAV